MIKKIIYNITILIIFIVSTGAVQAMELSISGNGSDSQSEIQTTQTTETQITQSNGGEISNNIENSANSGENTASANSGDTSISTGDNTVDTSVSNTANISQTDLTYCPGQGESSIEISGNGSDSQNSVNTSSSDTTDLNINQTAEIKNNLNIEANSGDNSASSNNGNVTVETGNITAYEEIKNEFINNTSAELTNDPANFKITISENGADSLNSIIFSHVSNINSTILNSILLLNDIEKLLNTGNNNLNNNLGDVFLKTGDIFSTTTILNGPINTNILKIICCETQIPPSPSPTPSPTSSPTPSDGKDGAQSQGDPNVSGGADAAEEEEKGGEVLGAAIGEVLPISGDFWTRFLTIISILLFALGSILHKKNPTHPKAGTILSLYHEKKILFL